MLALAMRSGSPAIDIVATATTSHAVAAVTVAAPPLPSLSQRRSGMCLSGARGCVVRDPRQRNLPLVGRSFAGGYGMHPWGSVGPARSAFVCNGHVCCRPLGARHPRSAGCRVNNIVHSRRPRCSHSDECVGTHSRRPGDLVNLACEFEVAVLRLNNIAEILKNRFQTYMLQSA